MAVGDALRRLCEEVGWSYAVFWKAIGAADPVHLVWEDGSCGHASCYTGSDAPEAGCEPGTSVCTLVGKVMASQIHVIGEGTIGRAAFTGNHQWIVHDPATASDHNLRPEVVAEMNHQFAAGIQTIAIIPVLPRGVLQLGATSVVVENTNLVLQYKKLCSQLNNRSSMASSSSVKNDLNPKVQSHPLNGPTSIYPADTRSKFFSGSPMSYQQCYGPDGTTVSSSILTNMGSNASMLMVAQRNAQVGKEHILYAPDMRFRLQNPYCDRRVESNTQSSVVSSGFISSISASMERHPWMTNSQQLEQGNTGEPSDLRNVLLKSLAYRHPLFNDNTNMVLVHGKGQVPGFVNGHGGFDFLPEGTMVFKGNLYGSTANQILDQRCSSTSEMSGHRPTISYKMPQSTQCVRKTESPKRETCETSAALSSGSDIQVSGGLKTVISQENNMSSSDLISPKKPNEVHAPTGAIVKAVKNMDSRRLPDISNERSPPLRMDAAAESDLFDMFDSEVHHLCRNVDNDLTCKAAKPENSNRDVPESSVRLGSSSSFNSVDDKFPYSGIFSLTDTDQLLDAVVSNVNPGGKQISGDSTSCKTSAADIPTTSYCRLKEPKQSESSSPLLIKNELAVSNFVKQSSFQEKAEDGCLSQNNAIQKSQIRLWIENGQNMKCESASASNSKGVDMSSKASRKRSRPGENPKPRPKDRQLIQDRIKELRELVPNGAKILGGENGPLKDYFEGGATWALDVGSRSMTCPIIVEDLERPRQMLVEMLCEDRGIFLEIADFIKGLGLTILRGVMEARKNKIWARFTVEANRNVTRMEIFLSLMRMLEPSCGAGENSNNNIKMPLGIVQYPIIPATGHLR
ncbi:transcription factor LHW isoform X2 [Zea mays]|uniref:transcription factor LHW isoform X2 n=1 Tax=Zea mays TaxID=4577 RepID=UPI0004DE9C6A|nr:transcription factor LHW isoform X2 [Zea mays]|eukprot:XP_008674454.1 transcription factor LHW isoform X2 [Zea mays]